MSIFSPLPENASSGDRARRRGTLCLLFALAVTPLTVLLYFNLHPLWTSIVPLEGIAFMLAATLFGAVMALTPVLSAAGWLLALWYGVESIFMPRERRTPIIDIIITGAGLVAWFLPALGFLVSATLALFSGQVHSKDHMQAQDPIAFIQGIGYQLIAAGILGWLAWRYWRGKLHSKPDDV